MATTIAFRVAGPTYALSVTASAHAALAVLPKANDQVNYAAFINTGATVVCVVMAQLPATGTAAVPVVVFPVDGTPTIPNSFILPAAMVQPMIVSVPTGQTTGFSVGAIGSAAGPSIIYVTPVEPVG